MIRESKKPTIIKCILFFIFTIACCVNDVKCYAQPPYQAIKETKQQCETRNRENNKKLEDAGYYISDETKHRQQELCDQKE